MIFFVSCRLCVLAVIFLGVQVGKTLSPPWSKSFANFEPQPAESERPAAEEIERANQQLHSLNVPQAVALAQRRYRLPRG